MRTALNNNNKWYQCWALAFRVNAFLYEHQKSTMTQTDNTTDTRAINFGIFVERQIHAAYVCELEIAWRILCFAIAVVIFRVSNAHCSWHS